ncbi:MAG TPA: TolC family protein, partial [Gemmatimonadaceae bacterium]|nr:TolC family protein [Gemmatimonadaceae bacterium]
GQMLAAAHAASAPERAAQLEITAQRAQVMFDVAQAYYDAALADELVTIADSTMAMDERTLAQARTAKRVGNASDFDLLESQVTRDNQVPLLVQAKAGRDERYLRLKQLIGLPLDAPLTLTTTVEDSIDLPGGVVIASLSDTLPFAAGDTAVDHRSSVREEQEAIVANQALLSESRAEYFPSLSLTSSYQRVAFPTGGLPAWNSFLNNWTIGVTASVPIFNGFKTHGDVLVAQANLETEKARYNQARDAAALDARSTVAELRAAEASWRAVSTSGQQAVQAYQIAELRYREGLSSLVELNGSRLARQQSFSNRAQAARNLQVARMRAALIRDLPLAAK